MHRSPTFLCEPLEHSRTPLSSTMFRALHCFRHNTWIGWMYPPQKMLYECYTREWGAQYPFYLWHLQHRQLVHKEGWLLKNWCFWIVVLEETLESPLDCKENKPIHLKEINPDCSLEGQILKLRLQYFGHLMRREDSLEKTQILGKCEGKRRRGRRRMRWSLCHWSYQHEFDPTLGGSGRQEGLACCGPWGHKESDTT